MNLTLIKTFTYSYETTNTIGVLTANDIEFYLQESTISNTFDYLGKGENGIKLFVNAADETKAINVLIDAGLLNKVDRIATTLDINKIIKYTFMFIVIIILILLLIYFL